LRPVVSEGTRRRVSLAGSRLAAAVALGALLGAGGDGDAGALRVALEGGRVLVDGAPADAPAEALAVSVAGADRALLGRAERRGEQLVFTPRFPFEPGLRYRVELQGDPPRLTSFAVPPRAPAAAPRVSQVYPTASEVPENWLKLYIEFSRPMSQGRSYDFLQVLDAQGTPLDDPFVEITPELWDPAGTRLTVLFDPGRLKRGLLPNREVGPPLAAGGEYTLVVDAAWLAPDGVPLGADVRRTFRVTAADREPPDPARWTLHAPRAGAREAFCAEFPEPLDRALLESSLAVWHAERPISGVISTDRAETQWCLLPDSAWEPGSYALRVDPRLEDLAGNSIGRAFDVDLGSPLPRDTTTARGVALPFSIPRDTAR